MKPVLKDEKFGKFCVVPLDKEPLPPVDGKSKLVLSDFYDKGVDNAAYFSPIDVRRAKRCALRSTEPSEAARLSKVPGLNIWRLDFRPTTPRWPRVAAALITLALLGTCAAVIAHAVRVGFGFPWLPFVNEVGDPPGVSQVAAHFRIMNRNFISELKDPSSTEYIQLETDLKHTIDVLFLDSPLTNYYNGTDHFEFSNGSVVVSCVVRLKRPLAEGAKRVGFTFLKALEAGKGILLPGLFYVDVHTVRFTAIKTEAYDEENLHSTGDCKNSQKQNSDVTDPPFPLPSSILMLGDWSEWSRWTSCLTFRRLCDPEQLQQRTRSCRAEGRPLPTAVCVRGTGESALQIRHCPCGLKDNA